jgi:hypothetical protein
MLPLFCGLFKTPRQISIRIDIRRAVRKAGIRSGPSEEPYRVPCDAEEVGQGRPFRKS